MSKFKIGDNVHVLPDVETIYTVTKVHLGPHQTFYDVIEPLIENVPESQLEPAI